MKVKTNKFRCEKVEFSYGFHPTMHNKEYVAVPVETGLKSVTFQRAMKVTLFAGQLFGLIPVIGISEDDASKVRFSYFSGRCVYSIISVLGQAVFVCFSFLKIFWDTNTTLNSNSGIVFYACNSLVTVLFLRLAIQWPNLCRRIAVMEYSDPTTDGSLIWKCNLTSILLLVLGAVEHSLSDISGLSAAMACAPDEHPYDAHLEQDFYWIWVFIPYHTLVGLIAKFICIQCTFNWNYSGVFVMCICMYLSARLQQVNDRIHAVREKVAPATFWQTMREDYTNTTSLIRRVDHLLSSIVFVSFAINLFSICFLLLHVLDLLFGFEHVTYYLFSVILLILRSLAMSLLAAKVNSTSNQTAVALYDVPADAFNVEVQRFIDQVHGDSIVLSGLHFFSIKRGMVLTIAAAIVTYELVLLQFSGANAQSQ